MFDTIIKKLFPEPRTNLQVVLDKIESQEQVRSATLAMSRMKGLTEIEMEDCLNFMVGTVKYWSGSGAFKYFKVMFSNNDDECVISTEKSDEPLFLFNNREEVKQIREAVITKYNQMVENRKKFDEQEFESL